ncbi:MAG TPA: ribosome recycling factor [Miltoncostaeaceae bacterium]|nr:ribosome recycling factor [Miltoncostaeaceae bacterium]
MKERVEDAKRRMEGAVKALTHDLATVRTGRASVALLDRIQVDAYGQKTPLNQIAQLSAPEPRLLTIQPYDRSIFGAVEKAILESDLGVTPSNDGQVIRIALPQPTEQRRKELVKLVGKMAEDAKVAVRNVRRDVLNEARRAEKEGEVSRNEMGRFQDEVQKLTDAEVKAIDEVLGRKEAEIMEV